MTDPQVELIKSGLVELFREIHSGRLDGALRMAHGWALEETPTQVHTSGGGISRPTESRALNGSRTDPTEAVMRSHMESIELHVKDLVVFSRQVQPITGIEADRRHRKENAITMQLAPCASLMCDDQAPEGDRHCEPCAAYLDARPGTMQVPRDVILSRQRMRKQAERRRIRVDGPLAETEGVA